MPVVFVINTDFQTDVDIQAYFDSLFENTKCLEIVAQLPSIPLLKKYLKDKRIRNDKVIIERYKNKGTKNLHQFFNLIKYESKWRDMKGCEEENKVTSQALVSKVLFNKRVFNHTKKQFRGHEFDACRENFYFDLQGLCEQNQSQFNWLFQSLFQNNIDFFSDLRDYNNYLDSM